MYPELGRLVSDNRREPVSCSPDYCSEPVEVNSKGSGRTGLELKTDTKVHRLLRGDTDKRLHFHELEMNVSISLIS
jgi:hypothetical protein